MRIQTQRGIGIHSDAIYTLQELQSLGYSEAALRKARRQGLQVRYIHKRGHVYGADWIEYIKKFSKSSFRPVEAQSEQCSAG